MNKKKWGYSKAEEGPSKTERGYQPSEGVTKINRYPTIGISKRGIGEGCAKLYGVRTSVDSSNLDPLANYFPYYDKRLRGIAGFKKKDLTKPKKERYSAHPQESISPKNSALFGQNTVSDSRRVLFICEGEEDAMALNCQIRLYNQKSSKFKDAVPNVVSIGFGTANAVEHIMTNIDFVKEFNKVVLVFDGDKATPEEEEKGIVKGLDAVSEVTLAFPELNINYVPMGNDLKDVCEYVYEEKGEELARKALFESTIYLPPEILILQDTEEELESYLKPIGRGWYVDAFPNLSDCLSGFRKHEMTLLLSDTNVGKANPNSTPIPTPVGWRTVGDIRPGDYLFDKEGRPTKVLETYPQGVIPNFRVTFSDNTYVDCSKEHLWTIRTVTDCTLGKPWRTLSLEEIMKFKLRRSRNGYTIEIPVCAPVQYEPKDYIIDPYQMGFILGDGYCNGCTLSCTVSIEDVEHYCETFDNLGTIRRQETIACFQILGGVTKIKELDLYGKLSGNKFIPKEYLLGSVEQRKALLAGLVDTDGTVCVTGTGKTCSFSTTSRQLTEDFCELVRSLGGLANVTEDPRVERYTSGFCSRVSFRLDFNPFTLPRKKELYDSIDYQRTIRKWIKSIEPVEDQESTCFKVDNKDHLFLIGKEYIVTHNSLLAKQLSMALMKSFPEEIKVGAAYLEDGDHKAMQNYIALYNEVSPSKFRADPSIVPREKVKEAYDFLKDRVAFYNTDAQSKLTSNNFVNVVRRMAVMGYNVIIVDHLSFISSGSEKDERRNIDVMLTELNSIFVKYPVHIICVAHINRQTSANYIKPIDPETKQIIYPHYAPVSRHAGKGSSSYEQIASNMILMEKEVFEDEATRGKVRLVVKKNRETGTTRICDELWFNPVKGRFEC